MQACVFRRGKFRFAIYVLDLIGCRFERLARRGIRLQYVSVVCIDKMPQFLRGYAGNGSSHIAIAALVHTADARRQEFRMEPSVASSPAVRSNRTTP